MNDKKKNKEIARKRIDYLFNIVKNGINIAPEYLILLQHNALKLIYMIRTKYNIRLKQSEKMLFENIVFILMIMQRFGLNL